jgi:uncharacterized protein YwqG
MEPDTLYAIAAAYATKTGMGRVYPILKEFLEPALAFSLVKVKPGKALKGKSHQGGMPDLPVGFQWPEHSGRPLDFLLQVNCAELAEFDLESALPKAGLLAFFYDLEEQPWGYDPDDLDGFKVAYFENSSELKLHPIPAQSKPLPTCALQFSACLTAPSPWSRVYEKLQSRIAFKPEEEDNYFEFIDKLDEFAYSKGGQHRLLGHPANLQGDMQLEAQLVTHGINCGGPEGYRSAQAKPFEAGADDWRLLLQLDSDSMANLTWGDAGMLYFWIRKEDLQARAFERAWMKLQCS